MSSAAAMDQTSLEALAHEVRSRAGVRDDDVVVAPRIAMACLGRQCIRELPNLTTSGALVRIDGAYRIYIRRGMQDVNFTVSHELAHWALRELAGYSGPDEELYANFVGAAIVAAPGAMRAARRWIGDNVSRLAKAFVATQSLVVLRLAEVFGEERALVTSAGVRVRSFGGFAWPTSDVVKTWASGRAPRGLAKVRLRGTYDRGRVALHAA